MKKLLLISFFIVCFHLFSYSQVYKNWENEDIEEFYEKVSVKSGTLGEDGRPIDFVLIPATMNQGAFEVEITDFKSDLYEIKGTDYYIKFKGYYGYAGYSDEGILVVGSSAWSSTFYKKP